MVLREPRYAPWAVAEVWSWAVAEVWLRSIHHEQHGDSLLRQSEGNSRLWAVSELDELVGVQLLVVLEL